MSQGADPNFPSDLDIRPLENSTSESDVRFDSTAQAGAILTYGIAGRIWEASHAMLAYLDPSSASAGLEFDPAPLTRAVRSGCTERPITAIELGSGTGFVAARVGEWLRPDLDLLIATDLPDVCPLLESNLHSCAAVCVRPLSWGSWEHVQAICEELGVLSPSPRPFTRYPTHILCSDLVYFPALLAPLLRSLLHLTSPPFVASSLGPPSIIISYKIRSLAKETPFWSAFGLWFHYAPVLVRKRHTGAAEKTVEARSDGWTRFAPEDDSDERFVLVATRRPESLSWTVPETDAALLAGMGAYGSQSSKSDDQFEQLLLMGMDI